ncbi:response regulator transcription factor [Raoultibacter phocaeensis]|uniref:response regulator transcription factor n=1 Tax=Raoultibacter phocaeensis TaxID=2479841 RepID=UPI00111AC4D1|nr:response regulator transcription factor [Raoultibacter phocaeensis]
MRLLIAEDDVLLGRAIADALVQEGYEVDALPDGADSFFYASQGIYDLLVLDITMPGMSGLEIVESLRAEGFDTPVLFVTARDTISDRVRGLSIGGDDYLVKPFALAELIARVHALLRRSAGESSRKQLVYGAFELDLLRHEARYRENDLSLTVMEFELLEFLIINKGSIVTRGQISDRLWGYDSDIGFGILDVHIHNLRKKLAAASCIDAIKTIRGVGYQFKTALEIEPRESGENVG